MMKELVLVVFLITSVLSLRAQEECAQPTDKKLVKLLDKSRDKKYNLTQKIEFLEDAVSIEEDCVPCHYQLGVKLYRKAKANGTSYQEAISELELVKQECPDFSSDVYYYLGIMHYGNEDWNLALTSFKSHQQMEGEDNLPRDFDRKKEDIDDVILELQFKQKAANSTINIIKTKVKGVSSSIDEYLPTISLDNELMFYTRKYEKKAKGDIVPKVIEEFCMSRREDVEVDFDKGIKLPPPFNQGDNYGGATISVDNREMFITICKPGSKGYNNCDIYTSRLEKQTNPKNKKEEFQWTTFENLGTEVNTKDGWESQPSLNADGNILYFSTARETSIKNKSGVPGMDIYYTERDEKGVWSKAQSLGEVINSPGNEKSPFMHGDSKTLYFSSDGYGGVGKYDLFFTRLKDDGSWSKPRNLGEPINTEYDEHGMIVSTDGLQAYYASNRIAGAEGYDIYTFPMPEIARPEKVLLIKGELKDEEGNEIVDATLEVKYIDSKKVDEIKVNSVGEYAKIINIQREAIVLTVVKDGYAFDAHVYSEKDTEEKSVVKTTITLQKIEEGKPYRINDITYPTASPELNSMSQLILNEFADYLNKHKSIKISIHGHTDNVGNKESNQSLSTQRAAGVMAYLIGRKVSPERLTFKGHGDNDPIESNKTEEGRARNRRTEFVIESK